MRHINSDAFKTKKTFFFKFIEKGPKFLVSKPLCTKWNPTGPVCVGGYELLRSQYRILRPIKTIVPLVAKLRTKYHSKI